MSTLPGHGPQAFRTMGAAALATALCSAGPAAAQSSAFSSFTPLPASVAAGALPEAAPFLLAHPGWQQRTVADRGSQLNAGQVNPGAWDMIDGNRSGPEAGRYLFSGFETSPAGIQRWDRQTGQMLTLWHSLGAAAPLNTAFGFDAARWTPFGTFITAEESWGPQPQPLGRLFELTNPVTATAGGGTLALRGSVARVAHEGLAFDQGRHLYYVDEFNGGAVYRYTSAAPLQGGTYFDGGVNAVLRVGDGLTPGATGAATWVPFTTATGAALPGAVTVVDPAGLSAVDGRATVDLAAFKGTDFNRPEDLEIQTLGNGQQVLYFTATGSHEVYSLNLATMQLRLFAGRGTVDAVTGVAVGSAFTNPDNLAIDADGNVYVVEDQPAGQADIWLAVDADRDGVAESLARWATLATVGAEPTGLYFDVTQPNLAYVNVQHPSNGIDRMIEISAVPEPGTAAQWAAGLLLLLAVRPAGPWRVRRSALRC